MLKRMTGGDSLSGREMYGDRELDFAPTHTLAIVANPIDMPVATVFDKAMAARIRILPFDHAPERENPHLVAGIVANELPYVAAWAIEGARGSRSLWAARHARRLPRYPGRDGRMAGECRPDRGMARRLH